MKKKTEKAHKKDLPTLVVSVIPPRKRGGPIMVNSNLEFHKHADIREADGSGALEIIPINFSINATPEDWQKLDAAITDDRGKVIDNLRLITEAVINHIKGYGRPKGRPPTEVRVIKQIKRSAPPLYAYLQCFKNEEEKPLSVRKLLSLLESKGYDIKKYNAIKFTRATMEILYWKKAHDELLKPFLNPDNFYKTYILPQPNPYIGKFRISKEYFMNHPNKIPTLLDVFKALKISLKGTTKLQ
jgi:hypothetical protein